jgi:TonB family protein
MVGLEKLLIGRTLDGRYTVEEMIGQGRGGLVYRARHSHTGTEVALKVLAAPASPEARERYRKLVAGEVRAAAAIEHPNVAGVYAMGHDGELDVDFVTSELLRGQSLASVLSQRGKPPIALGLRLLSDAAEGLAVGHRAGLVHRDLRPASLYLVRSEAERQVRVKVAGFGVPQIVRRESVANAGPEIAAYASPEMLANGSLRLTPASDVFSLGVVGYELITGRLPFDEAARAAMAEGRAVEAEHPTDVPAAVPPQVVEAVMRALHNDPAQRLFDGSDFSDALQEPVRRVVAAGKIAPAAAASADASASAPVETASAEAASSVSESPEAAPPASESPEAVPVLTAAAAAAAPAVVAAAATVAAEPVAATPPPAPAAPAPAARTSRKAPGAATPDLELYYPPEVPKAPLAVPIAAPAAREVTIPAPAAPPAAVEEKPAPAIPIAAVAASPEVVAAAPAAPPPTASPAAETKPAPVAETPAPAVAAVPASPAPTVVRGLPAARAKRNRAGGGGFRGSAMAAGFVLGILVLGTAAWMVVRRGSKPTVAAPAPAGQLAQNATALVGAATPQPAADTPAAALTAANEADRTPEQREADAAARRKQQEDERRRLQEQNDRLAQPQAQQPLAQAQAAATQPVAPPAAQPQPQPQQVALTPSRPSPQVIAPPAPPPAPAPAPVREESAAPSANAIYDENVVEERPRLTNVNELQRALQDRYPPQLYANRISGRVMASFVVGLDGRVDGSSIRILSTPNAGFNGPTATVLRRARFRPATVKGQPVRVQVTMPIAWTID